MVLCVHSEVGEAGGSSGPTLPHTVWVRALRGGAGLGWAVCVLCVSPHPNGWVWGLFAQFYPVGLHGRPAATLPGFKRLS